VPAVIAALVIVGCSAPTTSEPPAIAIVGPVQTVVSLTFDDGRATAYTARPILAAHGMRATFYVNSPLLGSSSFYMTWDQVEGLYADGNEIGGHTAYHTDLTAVDSAEAQRQVCEDRVNLITHGFRATDFAYAYGAYNPPVESIVQACGYNSARTTDVLPGGAESLPLSQPYTIGIGSGSGSLASLEGAVSRVEGTGGWVPLLFHDVCSDCSSVSISEADFTSLLDWLQGQSGNGVVVKTVQQVVGGSMQPAVAGQPTPAASNGADGEVLHNPSLEMATGATPTCWLLGGYGANTYAWARTTDAHSGDYSENLRITAYTSGDRKLMSAQDAGSCAPGVTAGHKYLITVWYKSSSHPYIVVYYRNAAYSWVYWTQSADLAYASSWTKATFATPAVPTGGTDISVGMGLSSLGWVTMDDFALQYSR
jgi:peptidoglycan/xylan/chitin deacetylase (PgdA/CDA1 family)